MGEDADYTQLRTTIRSLYDARGINRLKKRIAQLNDQALRGEGTQSPMSLVRLRLLKERLAELTNE